MATGIEIATAWVRLVPTFEGVQKAIADEVGPAAEKEGKESGKRFGGAMAGAVAGIVAPLAASALQGIKDLVGEMAAQVDSTKKFRSTLEFADVSDANIKKLTKSTQDYADKTVYSLGDIRNITAQLASNGVKDFDKLAQAGGNLNAIAGGNAETFKSVGMVITQTAGQGKLTAENWNQLSDAIPGASGKIQEALLKNGAFVGNFREAMSKGEITSEEFNAALMELGSSPVAVAAAESTETFEGSIGNLQASIVKVGAGIMTKLQPAFTAVVGGLAEIISKVAPVMEFFFNSPPLIAGFAAALLTALAPSIWAAVTATWAWTAALLANPLTWIVLAVGALVAGIVYLATQTTFFQDVWKNVTDFISTAITWLWTEILEPIFKAIGDIFTWLWTYVIKPIVDFVVAYFQLWGAIVTWLYDNVLTPIFAAIAAVFEWVWGIISTIIDLIVNYFRLVGAIAVWLYENAIQPMFKAIGDIFDWIWNSVIKPVIDWIIGQVNLLGLAFNLLYTSYIQPMFAAIGAIFNWLWTNVVQPIIDWINERVALMGLGFKLLYEDFIQPAFKNIQSVLSTVWNWIDQNVFAPFKVGIDLIGKAFENTAKAIGTAWDSIKAAAAIPINFVLDTVWNKGLRSFWNDMVGTLDLNDMKLPEAPLIKFASGGVLPGYTPGRDVHQFVSPTGGRLALSGGEAIMRPEFTRLVGGAAGVARLNAMARQGDLGFKTGGVIPNLGNFAGDVLNNVAGAASKAWEFISNPVEAVQKNIIEGIINPLLGGAGNGVFGKLAGSLPGKLMKQLAGKIPKTGVGTPGMGWEAMWNIVKGALPGAVLTDGYRSPSANAAAGGVNGSYHTMGRAIDVVPANMDTFNAIAKLFPNATELIYTPAGDRQLSNGKSFTGWSEAVRAQHYSHIHLAMREGGVFPGLPGLMNGGTITKAGYTVVGEQGPELLKLPAGAQVNPDYDDIPTRDGFTFNNYAPLGSTPSQELETFANRSEAFLP